MDFVDWDKVFYEVISPENRWVLIKYKDIPCDSVLYGDSLVRYYGNIRKRLLEYHYDKDMFGDDNP